ncbi:MAG: type II secretion system GspH family protein [Betaproteobacteria bacterium]|nr:type II secretion system GspH family protein [Betaproteobacteria bacterium]
MPTGEARRAGRRAHSGFGYVWALLAVAVFGIGLGAVGEIWRTQAQREREAELLRVGREYRAALYSYFASSKVGTPAFPTRLEELLEDRRGPVLRRHLRKIYADPLTASQDWGLLTSTDGRIRGVYSRSGDKPLKTGNFGPQEGAFEQAQTYADWRFEYVPPRVATPQRR